MAVAAVIELPARIGASRSIAEVLRAEWPAHWTRYWSYETLGARVYPVEFSRGACG